MDVCILLSTCDKYEKLAELTVCLIDQRWENHPPIFVCGMSHPLKGDVETFLIDRDSSDWIGIAQSASQQLLEKGYQKFYLILEDHPPLGVCNEMHLNKTLPELMNRLDAAYIGLHGWDQNTFESGVVLRGNYNNIQKQSDSFLWRYALHPALWNIQAFKNITDTLIGSGEDIAMRSVWAFERRSGALSFSAGKSYRIFRLGMLGGDFKLARKLLRRFVYLLLNSMFIVAKKIFGVDFQSRLVDYFTYEILFFDGPYPLYWSGVMQKGSLHKNFERFLLSRKRNDELTSFRIALK